MITTPSVGIERRLRPSRRFAHAAAYLERSAADVGLVLRQHERLALRRDGAGTVDGHVMVFERPAAAAAMPGPMPVAAVATRRRRPRRG